MSVVPKVLYAVAHNLLERAGGVDGVVAAVKPTVTKAIKAVKDAAKATTNKLK